MISTGWSGKEPSFPRRRNGFGGPLLTKMARESPVESPPPSKPYPAEKARGGESILRTKARKAIFIAGLAGCVLLALLVSLFAR